MGSARRMAPQAPKVRTPALACTAHPASAARWFARQSRSPTGAYSYHSGGDGLGFCGRWALPGEWRRRRPRKMPPWVRVAFSVVTISLAWRWPLVTFHLALELLAGSEGHHATCRNRNFLARFRVSSRSLTFVA